MKISYKWIREYIDLPEDAATVAEALTMSGIEVEEIVHERIPEEILSARIVAVRAHPGADRLSVCRVDVGGEELEVVCGAPNVRAGLMSAFAPVGANLGPGMLVKKAKIRGVESVGVLLSEKELGLTDDHSGIMELEDGIEPGVRLSAALDLEDWVLDINVTPNRGDCLSVIGIARELSAIFRRDLRLPAIVLREAQASIVSRLSVRVEAPQGCPRYTARFLEEVSIAKSPFSLRRRLYQSGVRAISNVVDITNYVLLEYGQPLHAFDSTLISDQTIVVRMASKGERFVTLDSSERTLTEDDLLICDPHKAIALAGIMGGENTEVRSKTREVVLESACFDPVQIRRSSKRLGLSTEASYRFERGIDPQMQLEAVNRASQLMQELAGARLLAGAIDVDATGANIREIALRRETLTRVLGLEGIDPSEVHAIFSRLGCAPTETALGWTMRVPGFRHDLEREIDLVEEFIRIHGMDKVEPQLPAFRPTVAPERDTAMQNLRLRLGAMGLTEVVTYSFIAPKWGPWLGGEMLALKNPISDEMRCMRISLVPGLAETTSRNKKQQTRDVFIFEIGRCFFPQGEGLPRETPYLGIALSGRRREPGWSESAGPVDFYDLKGIVEALIEGCGCEPSGHAFLRPGMQADLVVAGKVIGRIGALHPDLQESLDCEDDIFVAELEVASVLATRWAGLTPIHRFPSTSRDLSLVIDDHVAYRDILQVIQNSKISDLRQIVPIDMYTGEKLPRGKRGLTIRITYQSGEKTLEDGQVNAWQETLVADLERELSITLRQ